MKRYHYILAIAMVLTGTMNTLVVKYADNSCAKGVDYYPLDDSPDDNPCSGLRQGDHQFDHPFVQALAMFIGEFMCMIAFKIVMWNAKRKNEPPPMELGKQNWNPLIFFLPALCDCGGTSLMYLGMTYTYPSQFQMLRGSVVIFTGLLSFFWLKRRLIAHHWVGMLFVLFGLGIVGLSAVLQGSSGASAPNPVLGDILIVCAQVIVALQMVVEEKFLTKHQVPALQAVGWEGIFGMGVMSLMCIIFYYVPGPRAGKSLENVNDAMAQFVNSTSVKAFLLTMICSIALFNFCGISVTKEMSATTRMVLDNIRTITVWAWGVGVGWEKFQYLEIIGFIMLLIGTLVYNDIVITPLLRRLGILKPAKPEYSPVDS